MANSETPETPDLETRVAALEVAVAEESPTDLRLLILETRLAELQAILVAYLPDDVTGVIRKD